MANELFITARAGVDVGVEERWHTLAHTNTQLHGLARAHTHTQNVAS